ncbi:hypothetical protein [Streptomyces sp. NPDC046261]|uniref:hypothetical protein n=1 Tax=Streptomyces sp. NPDC046261 TaxID=3157200 RepID=UPI0033DBCE65
MKRFPRTLATAAATLLLTLGGTAALATPAQADVHLNVGDLVTGELNQVVDASVAGINLVHAQNPVGGALD